MIPHINHKKSSTKCPSETGLFLKKTTDGKHNADCDGTFLLAINYAPKKTPKYSCLFMLLALILGIKMSYINEVKGFTLFLIANIVAGIGNLQNKACVLPVMVCLFVLSILNQGQKSVALLAYAMQVYTVYTYLQEFEGTYITNNRVFEFVLVEGICFFNLNFVMAYGIDVFLATLVGLAFRLADRKLGN